MFAILLFFVKILFLLLTMGLFFLVILFFAASVYYYIRYNQLHHRYSMALGNNDNYHQHENDFVDEKSQQEIIKNLQNNEFIVNFSNYLNRSHPDFAHEMKQALTILGKYLKVSRISVFEENSKGDSVTNTYEWCNIEIDSKQAERLLMNYQSNPKDWRMMLYKDGLIYAKSPLELPSDLKEMITSSETMSILILPLYIENDLHGFISFENSDHITKWNDLELGFLKNITLVLAAAFERQIASKEIEQSEGNFRDLFNNSNELIFIYNKNGQLLEVNNMACSCLSFRYEELVGINIRSLLRLDIINQDLFFSDSEQLFENEILDKNGKKIPIEVSLRRITLNERTVYLFSARNITERKQMERELLSAIIQAEEQERGRIARDLHDGLAPLLASIKLFVKVLGTSEDVKQKEDNFKSTIEVVDECILLIKEISNNLSPNVLEDFGLASAIHSFCKKITLTKTMDIKFDSNVFDIRFDPNIEMIFFRILKELVNNTIRHANATCIEIFLLKTDNVLSLIYSDNGKGFDVKSTLDNRTNGMGIANMINRIGSINGKLLFESQPGKGIQVRIELKIDKLPAKS